MKLRNRNEVPWQCRLSEIFEAAYYRRLASIDPNGFLEILQNFEALAKRDPRMVGVPHPDLVSLWVYESPALARLPSVVFIYTIDDKAGMVDLWNCFLVA
ncbi:hypothetical protein SBA_ch1_04300 [Sphingomonas bisphenolicum]|uniref:Plasmid stabilization system n=1 Tax=Sphingomonas bisphenolicum TaxID=296544 RepID=A0ABM7G123_9SPHN|nr:hypothetical protein SBA_ch1_04300 [Sphingomonas bisphenolicum]